jgi:hypothetical protein
MKKAVGVWIDSRTAVIAAVAARGGTTRITTDLEKQLRLSSGERGETEYGRQVPPADDRREKSSRAHLRVFFDAVVAAVRGASSIFLFGPGGAKGELRKRLELVGLGGRVDGVETVGRLSDRQIAAKARDHYRRRGPAAGAGPVRALPREPRRRSDSRSSGFPEQALWRLQRSGVPGQAGRIVLTVKRKEE